MTKITVLLLILLPALLFGQKTKQVTEKYTNPWFTEVYNVLKSDQSVKHGNYKKLGFRNAIVINGFYTQGLKDSIWTENYWSGGTKSRGEYSQDQKIGIWEYYDSGGNLEQRYDYSERKLIYDNYSDQQKDKEFTVVKGSDTIKTKLDHGPVYIGGSSSMLDPGLFEFPRQAIEKSISGTVYVVFIVDKNGKTVNHRVKKGLGYGCDEAALRGVKRIPDNWIPGELNGQAVDV